VESCGTAGQATDNNIIRRMRFACWITKAKYTHREYVILIAFPKQQWLHERASVLRYTYIACLFFKFNFSIRISYAIEQSIEQKFNRLISLILRIRNGVGYGVAGAIIISWSLTNLLRRSAYLPVQSFDSLSWS
jgi:fatty acid desaturase